MYKAELIKTLRHYGRALKEQPEITKRLKSATQRTQSEYSDRQYSQRYDIDGTIARLSDRYAENEVFINEFGSVWDCLSDDEKLILTRFYVSRTFEYVELLCEELYCERSEIYRRKDAAMRHLLFLYFGIDEKPPKK